MAAPSLAEGPRSAWPGLQGPSCSWALGSCMECFSAIGTHFRSWRGDRFLDHVQEREEFERAVAFLASVPLFRKQLPRSELPKIAQSLTRHVWRPGQLLVRKGEMGRAFFLIQAGEALVLTDPGGGPEQACATLAPGDYFGGHTLTTEQRNVATILAKGPAPLVTLSMSRLAFEECGISRKMHFRGPAVYVDFTSSAMTGCSTTTSVAATRFGQEVALPSEEVAFICAALRRNVNLRALHHASDDMLHGIARAAERREVPKGMAVAEAGDLGQEFFIVRKGSFAVIQGQPDKQGQQSAEAAVSRSSMAERLLRKTDFLRSLAQCSLEDSPGFRRRRTMCSSRSKQDLGDADGSPKWSAAEGPWSPWTVLVSPAATLEPYFARGASPDCLRCNMPVLLPLPARSKQLISEEGPSGGLTSAPSAGTARGACSATFKRRSAVRRPGKQPRQGCTTSDVEPSKANAAAAGDASQLVTFGVGESFGELSLLYNARREATFLASEDAVVYVVGRRPFTACFSRKGQRRFKEYCKLLEEVHALAMLLSPERWELACNATGVVEFRPGERVLHQGRVREARQWYVVFSGSGVMSQDRPPTETAPAQTVELARLKRADHFGERSLLRGDAASQVHVDAGPQGMCCLTFDFEVIRPVLESIFAEADGFVPSVHCDIEEWCAGKALGWHRQLSSHDGSSSTKDLELQDLRRICVLGRGGYGQVLLVDNPTSSMRYALKVVSRGLVQRREAERQISWERELLLMVNTPFVVRLHKTFRDDQHVYFLLEAALGGSLLELVHTHSHIFTEDCPRGSSAAFYLACIVAALAHLHERRIVFRDLKLENALLDARGYVKLCDLGFARFVLWKTNTLAGTPDYMAPEMIDFPHTHDQSVDWWSLGVLGFELMAGQPPWEDEGISEPMGRLLAIRRSQERGRLEFPFHFPRVAKAFITALLRKLPERLGAAGGAEEVRGHGFWGALDFDFLALHAGTMPAPISTQELREEGEWEPVGPAGDLLLRGREDSLFEPCIEDGSNWDKDF